MTKLEQILEQFPDNDFIKLDGLDDAIIGVYADTEFPRLVYSIGEITECFVKQGMTDEEAIDFYEYNTARSIPYIDNAPILIYTDFF
jgi:hypothetical protein